VFRTDTVYFADLLLKPIDFFIDRMECLLFALRYFLFGSRHSLSLAIIALIACLNLLLAFLSLCEGMFTCVVSSFMSAYFC
jgi:hypothetical protein